MAISKDLKEAIVMMPQKEKDKTLLRLIAKDEILMLRLEFELLELGETLQSRRDEIRTRILKIAKMKHDTPGWMMMDMRSLSGDIGQHVKITKDKYGDIELNLFMLNTFFDLQQLLGIVRYQPTRRLTLYGTLMLSTYGADDQFNQGGNPLISYNLRPGLTVDKKFDLGNFIGQGHTVKTTFVDLRLSYMLKHNLFLEARQLFRNSDSPTNPLLGSNTTMSSLSVRYNLAYRQQVF